MSAMQPDDTGTAEDIKNLLIALFLFGLAITIYGALLGQDIDTSAARP